jgi:hypothetical protein
MSLTNLFSRVSRFFFFATILAPYHNISAPLLDRQRSFRQTLRITPFNGSHFQLSYSLASMHRRWPRLSVL